jgi:hypothetical protein
MDWKKKIVEMKTKKGHEVKISWPFSLFEILILLE